jgi:hypothetical protein
MTLWCCSSASSTAELILYGCGDLVNDYEGIAEYQQPRFGSRIDLEPDRLLTLRTSS